MAGPKIDLWYGKQQSFGLQGQPQRWVNILGRVSGVEPITALSYSLNGNAHKPLSTGPDQRRLAARGDFNIDLDCRELQSGLNRVEIVAHDAGGGITRETVELTYNINPCPLPYAIDWAHVGDVQTVAHIVDGLWTKDESGISPQEIGYDRLIAVGDMSWRDYEVTVPITVHGIHAACYEYPSVHAGVGVVLRWKGHANWGRDAWASGQPYFGPSPYGAIGWYCIFHDAGPVLNFFDPDFRRLAEMRYELRLHVPYTFKVRVETTSDVSSRYCLNVWQQGQPEPDDWLLNTPIEHIGYRDGAILLAAHHTAAVFGNVLVQPV